MNNISSTSLDKINLDVPHKVVGFINDNNLNIKQLNNLGLIKGAIVVALFHNMCKDSTAYNIKNSVVAIRNSDASKILVCGSD